MIFNNFLNDYQMTFDQTRKILDVLYNNCMILIKRRGENEKTKTARTLFSLQKVQKINNKSDNFRFM